MKGFREKILAAENDHTFLDIILRLDSIHNQDLVTIYLHTKDLKDVKRLTLEYFDRLPLVHKALIGWSFE